LGDREAALVQVRTSTADGELRVAFPHDQDITVEVRLRLDSGIDAAVLSLSVCDTASQRTIFVTRADCPPGQEAPRWVARVTVPAVTLVAGEYFVKAGLLNHYGNLLTRVLVSSPFRVFDAGSDLAHLAGRDCGLVFIRCSWDFRAEDGLGANPQPPPAAGRVTP
jgi:hypothetical protein